MGKGFIVTVLVGLMVIFGFQLKTDDSILWSSNVLTWEDFQGKAPGKNGYEAMTNSFILLEMDVVDGYLEVKTPTYFAKDKSWRRSDTSLALLKHEQVHFDIAELVARKIREDISELKPTNINRLFSKVEQIYNKHTRITWNNYNAYDRETDHGTIPEKQKSWENKVEKELQNMKAFSATLSKVKYVD